jgi:hypothetical protein
MEPTTKKDGCKKDYSSLNELKSKYEIFRKKYNLPVFYELNKIFDIEELDSEGDFLVRKIRRYISEKLGGYMRFIEILLNPSNSPIYFFKLIKKLDDNDREVLNKMYESLGKIEIETISLDLDYNEEKEAEFIKKLYKMYNEEIKAVLLEVLKKLENGENEKKKEQSPDGSYFG